MDMHYVIILAIQNETKIPTKYNLCIFLNYIYTIYTPHHLVHTKRNGNKLEVFNLVSSSQTNNIQTCAFDEA